MAYPLYLLEHAPASRLAAVAFRRLGRRFLDLLPLGGPIGEREILSDFGVASIEELPVAFERRVPGGWTFSDPERLRRAAAVARRRMPGETARAVGEAEGLAQGLVPIFGSVCVVARELRKVEEASPGWQAVAWERCPRTKKLARRGEVASGVDIKDGWALGRLDHTPRLALAALLARGDPRADDWAAAALDWCLDLAQAPRGVQWVSPMEVALRATNIALTLRALAAGPQLRRRPRALLRVLQSLDAHTAFVAARLEDDLVVPNNHLLADVVGLMAVGALVPQLERTRARALLLAPRFRSLVLEQTLEDGFGFEASTAYHRLAVELFLLGTLAARGLGVELGAEVEARIRAAFRASEKLTDGCGEAPQIGDADSGRALPFRMRGARDQSHLPGLGALLFSGPAEEGSWESLWLFGAGKGGRRRAPRRGDDALPSAGIYLQRSKRMSVAIACGPNGTGGTGSHGHNDKLSLEVCIDGKRLVVDPGSGRYTSDPALRNLLRGSFLHSTAIVDGEEQQEILADRLFALPEQARARCLLWESTSSRARFVGEHGGYLRLPSPVVHKRSCELVREGDRLRVRDAFVGPGSHRVEVRYLLPVAPTSIRIRPATPGEEDELGRTVRWVVEVLRDQVSMGILASSVAPSIERGEYAEGYGQLAEGTIIIFGMRGRLPLAIESHVSPTIGENRDWGKRDAS